MASYLDDTGPTLAVPKLLRADVQDDADLQAALEEMMPVLAGLPTYAPGPGEA